MRFEITREDARRRLAVAVSSGSVSYEGQVGPEAARAVLQMDPRLAAQAFLRVTKIMEKGR